MTVPNQIQSQPTSLVRIKSTASLTFAPVVMLIDIVSCVSTDANAFRPEFGPQVRLLVELFELCDVPAVEDSTSEVAF